MNEEENDYTGLEIAIVGMACQFKNSENYHQFWNHLKQGTECISYYTDEELRLAGVDEALISNPNFVKINPHLSRRDYFDYKFFGFHLREAGILSHQARLLMETVWSAFEDAGYLPLEVPRKVGVFCGANSSLDDEIQAILQQNPHLSSMESALLADKNYIASRLAYQYNFTGPALCVDTACSTSLVAIHLACQALLSGDCEMAVTGGATILSNDSHGYLYQEGMIYSKDGHTRSFDADATGTINSEGVGVVLLKPLSSAIKDNDHIHGVIRSTAINNDGRRKVGYTAPSVKAQTELIKNAQRAAEIPLDSICYIEAHGSGTIVGDPIEFKAILDAFNYRFHPSCKIGSVKSNIGHAIHAAGIAGIIKVILALQNKLLPPNINYKKPNPLLEFDRHSLCVNLELLSLAEHKSPLRACQNSLGIGGTNAFAICEEAPSRPLVKGNRSHYLLCLSAQSPTANQQQVRQIVDFLKEKPSIDLLDVSFTLHRGRTHFPHRAFLVVDSDLSNLTPENFAKAEKGENRPFAFIFPGLGLDYYPLGKELYTYESQFKAYVDECAAILQDLLQADFRLNFVDKQTSEPSFEIDQIVTFVFCYSYAKLFIDWGIEPSTMLGYSFGEIVAATLAGVFSLHDALRMIVKRGTLISRTPLGAMLSVPLPKQATVPLIADLALSIAIDNGESCVVAGAEAEIVKFEEKAKLSKLICMRLKAQQGIHSLLMDPILDDFAQFLSTITFASPKRPFISCVTGSWADHRVQTPDYWIQHLRQTMCFVEGMKNLSQTEHNCVIIGPQHEYTSLLKRFLPKKSHLSIYTCAPQTQYSDVPIKNFYQHLGSIWAAGGDIRWDKFYSISPGQRIPLPTYPFDKLQVIHKKSILELMQEFVSGHLTVVQSSASTPTDSKHLPETIVSPSTDEVMRQRMSTPLELPRNEVETQLVRLWEDFLGIQKIGIHDHFLELGGSSLKAITILARIHTQFGIQIPLNEFFHDPTIASLAHRISTEAKKEFVAIPTTSDKSSLPLTPTQQLYWSLEQQLDYKFLNQLQIVISKIDENKLHQAIQHCLQSNVIFSLKLMNEDPNNVGQLYYSNRKALSSNGIQLAKVADDRYQLTIHLSSLLSDGFTITLLLKQILEYYTRGHKNIPRVDFADYLGWRINNPSRENNAEAKLFWEKRVPWVNSICYRFVNTPSPQQARFLPKSQSYYLSSKDVEQIAHYAHSHKMSENTVFTALFSYLLKPYVKAEEYVVGIVMDERHHPETLNMPGMFRKLLPLVISLASAENFSEHLQRINSVILSTMAHKSYDYEIDLLLGKNATILFPAYHPIIQFHDTGDSVGEGSGDIQVHEMIVNKFSLPFAFKCDVYRSKENTECCFSYNSSMVAQSQIETLLSEFQQVVGNIFY